MFGLLTGFGLICLFLGITSLRQAREHYAKGQKADAVVVDIEEISWYPGGSGPQAHGFRAVYSYRDQAGNEHRLPGGTKSTSKAGFTLGEHKTIVYDPDSPTEVLDESSKVYASGAFYLVMAVAMIVVGILGFLNNW